MPIVLRRFVLALSLLLAAGPAAAGLLTLTVVGGVAATDGTTVVADPLAQESLSGSTLAQLGAPALFDPSSGGLLGLTVRITNTSDREILFPEFLPGVSVLSSISGVTGYSARTNVGAGGAAKAGGAGIEGTVSRFVLDTAEPLEAFASDVVGSHGGGGGAATGVAENWLSITGASGYELAAYLAGRRLAIGEFVDVPDFVRILAFGRSSETARIAFGFDIPTFSSGGVSVTSGAWTGAFTGPGAIVTPPPGPGTVPEPRAVLAWMSGLAGLWAARRRGRVRRERGREGSGE